MSSEKPPKAGLAEIFAVMSGIISEGAALSRQGQSNSLVGVASRAASLNWDAKYKLAIKPLSPQGDQEHVARPLLAFLEKVAPTLERYRDTGKVGLVHAHLEAVLAGEASESARPRDQFKDGGLPARPFKAAYLAKETEPVDPTAVVDDEEPDLSPELGQPKSKRTPPKQRRRSSRKRAAPDFEPAV